MNVYEVLGIKIGASDAVIVRAYRKKLKETEENLSGQELEEQRKRLGFANDILSNPKRRESYDKLLQKDENSASFDYLYQKHITSAPVSPEKQPFLKRTENFWYHYKIPVILTVFILAVGLFIFFSRDKGPKPDFNILLTGGYFFSDSHSNTLEKALEPYITDRNGDLLKTVNIINTAATPGSGELYTAYRSKFMAELSIGDKVFLILDKQNIEQILETSENVFTDLSEIVDSLPKESYFYDLSNSTVISKAFSDSKLEMPEEMLVALTSKNEKKYKSNEKYRNTYDDSVSLLKAVVSADKKE